MLIQIKLKDGLKVRDPLTRQFIPAEGCLVEDSLYWRKIERDGDLEVTEVTDEQESQASKDE